MASMNTGKQIANLLTESGKSAADMTHLVKVLGEGSMQKGLTRIGSFFQQEIAITAKNSLQKGIIQGAVAGSVGTIIAGGGIYGVYRLIKKKKNETAKDAEQLALHEAEGHAILNALKDNHEIVDDTDQGISPDPLSNTSSTDQQISRDILSSDDSFGEEESNTQNSFAENVSDVSANELNAGGNNNETELPNDSVFDKETVQEGKQPENQA